MRNFIKVARETIHICKCGYYEINGEKIQLQNQPFDNTLKLGKYE